MPSRDERARRQQMKDAYLRAEHAASAACMPVDKAGLEALVEHVAMAVEADGCDHSRGATDAWATANGVELARLHISLEEYGGYCDCEVVMNVHPDEVFDPVRQPPGA